MIRCPIWFIGIHGEFGHHDTLLFFLALVFREKLIKMRHPSLTERVAINW